MKMAGARTLLACCIGAAAVCYGAEAAPVLTPYATVVPATGDVRVGAAALAGVVATVDNGSGRVELRGVRGELIRAIVAADLMPLAPWIPTAQFKVMDAALSDSGRLVYIVAQDDPATGAVDDAVFRVDVETGQTTLFARRRLDAGFGANPRIPLAHFAGRLYVGGEGSVAVFQAGRNDLAGTLAGQVIFNDRVDGLAIDRGSRDLFIAGHNLVYRTPLATLAAPVQVAATGLPSGSVTGLAYANHYGGPANAGMYAATTDGSVWFYTPALAHGQAAGLPVLYGSVAAPTGLAATAEGTMLVGGTTTSGVRTLSDTADTRLGFEAWLRDEFAQEVLFGKGLISPDGEPAGWVIDADTWPQWNRFHPATPDAAAWTVLLCLMSDRITPGGDPQARPLVRQVLMRYAGQMPDGIAPSRTTDGIFRHWIDPFTGQTKPGGWSNEFATLSTMKIVIAAARARQMYGDDPQIRAAASAIICGVHNWDAYVRVSDSAMYFTALQGGGPNTGSSSRPFQEGIIFVEQVGRYGTSVGQGVYANWLNRTLWPTATYLTGRTVTGGSPGNFLPAFVTMYPSLLMTDYRSSSPWRTHIENLRASNAGWTDDNGPAWNTVFSAGTTKDIWGGYHADAINDSPGNVATFTSLMAFAGRPNPAVPPTIEAVGAYQAYRTGARQTFRTGATMLYRRSNVDTAYLPNSAGLPDVAIGALGLAELIQPGSVAAVLTGHYPTCSTCRADVARLGGTIGQDGQLTVDDVIVFLDTFFGGDLIVADIASLGGGPTPDGLLTADDVIAFLSSFFAACP